MGKFIQESKAFAMRGNVVDMAVGIILGISFGKIVSVLVANVIMPVVGMVVGKVDFASLKIVLQGAGVDAAGKATPEVAIGYGLFINAIVDFVIVALVVFLLVKALSAIMRKEPQPAEPPAPTAQEKLLAEIRDLLKAGQA